MLEKETYMENQKLGGNHDLIGNKMSNGGSHVAKIRLLQQQAT